MIFLKIKILKKLIKVWNRKLKFQKNNLCEVMKICQQK